MLRLRPGPQVKLVVADQRSRLEAATVELVSENVYDGVIVRALTRLAHISTGSFYKHFRSRTATYRT